MKFSARKICVVTGSRAEYGLLSPLMQGIQDSPFLELQLIVTGMHLAPEFGLTVQAIQLDGYHIDRKVESLLSSDTSVGIIKSIGLGVIGFADVLSELQPDLLVILGDRFEVFAAATAALISRIPIAHIHGGELTEGSFDDAIRHSITKMSHLHFVAADAYRQRVIQLGEQPDLVFRVGALGIDNIRRLSLLSRAELENQLDFKFAPRNLLITFHPVTLEHSSCCDQLQQLLLALEQLDDVGFIFTSPNADTDGRQLLGQITEFCAFNPMAQVFTSLGQLRYFSCLSHVDGVVGNSSSGLIEAPSFRVGTINIGDRQRGRLRAPSIIDCHADFVSISQSLNRLFSPSFTSILQDLKNPYGEGGACSQIINILETTPLDKLLKKNFFDVTVPA
ncbi:MAG: UDP-N-acetylglucosamine 2-epimerase (hydrolyzing) [Pelagibacteraceae bacterium TMED65]|jgi:GDP/UDP-N,N'-diacetylbacillosamine 2-epimerase (hydrolysing)|nr:MAG: UDP-N-acetylglucosamine 2-epimerase (hydrolyzing) [Pelagibacteraceae bacterium TMED65]|tara:strand:+ start:2361 stop:3536 length:1176 start_codon:yes stop_codon:yes gene_type:complete